MTLENYFKDNSMEVVEALENSMNQWAQIKQIQSLVHEAIDNNRRIFMAGMGGSAADAQHFAAELIARFEKEREPINAEALTTDTSVLTAIANDYSFEKVISRQLEAKAKQNDLFIAITTSGYSKSIIEALDYCKFAGVKSIVLTGNKHTKSISEELATVSFKAQSSRTSTIQTVHQVLYHSICEFIEQEIL